tara:strand:+ start:211 stop:723 length:513 start_codon:yes stop_codon:yes gene_type:complete
MRIILLVLTVSSLILVFGIFYKGLNKSGTYKPKNELVNIPEFSGKNFFKKENLKSKDIFNQNKFYLLNIWASWCVPCRDEHSYLSDLSKIEKLELIGINYKDKTENAKKFINEMGNPYSKILIDDDGTEAIELGAFGVPESFLIYNNKIVKKFIGPLNTKSVTEIRELIK